MKLAALIAFTALAASSTVALAGRVDQRQSNQIERIEAGRNTGAITWREGLKLRREQALIARTEAQFKADGHVTRDEKQALAAMQDKARNNIMYQSTDGWQRAWWMPRFGR